MPTSSVARLRLRAPVTQVAQARFRAEDALRLAVPDDRLLVLRRLDLGRLPARTSAAQWAGRAQERVTAQAMRAVHAAAPGSAAADAVWFHSFEEARALLLRELAAGRVPSAWFWRLAVRGWAGMTLAEWLPNLLADAVRDPTVEPAIARVMLDMVASGRLPVLVAALAPLPAPAPPSSRATLAQRPLPPTHEPRRPEEQAAAPIPDHAAAAEPAVLLRLDRSVRLAILRGVAALPASHPARAWIARLALIAAEPAILSQPATLAAWTESLAAFAAMEPSSAAEGPSVAARPDTTPPPRRNHRPEEPAARPASVPVIPSDAAGSDPPGQASALEPRPSQVPASPPSASPADATAMRDPSVEQRSQATGLFLLIRPLIRLDLPAWLDAHPSMAAQGFPRALLHAIAHRMRIPADDPVFAALRWTDDQDWSGPITAWRVGLDRWLRRTARIRLDQVVRRRGWIVDGGESLSVRFRVDDADIRLRRRALDVDPGWVPWLGSVIRYHYQDDPIA